MNEYLTYEHVVKKKRRALRVAAIVTYVVFFAGLTTLLLGFRAPALLFALPVLITSALIALTWKYVSVEYEYSLTGGEMTLAIIYGGRSRRELARLNIKSLTAVAPLEEEYIARAKHYAPEETFDLTADLQNPDVYYALFETEKKRRGILYFEATDRALGILQYYNPTVVTRAGK